jgi:photosystem II stability/assembly factor-like uncharacterized protein
MKPYYKFFCIILFLLCQRPVNAQGTWERVSVATTHSLNSICFTDSLTGWVAGDSGVILHTSDGGKNWNVQNSGTTNDIVSVFFLDRNRGWASSLNYTTVPYGTVLLKTTNGGLDWTGAPYPENDIFITCILYRDTLNGWMGGKPHALVRTTNGGITWTEARIDTSVLAFFPVLQIRFWDQNYGYACGGMFDIAGVIWRTSNGGDLWYAIDPSEAPADEVHELHLFDSTHVMGAGGDPDFGYGVGMIRTADGGLSWTYQELGIQGYALDLDFRTPREAWAPLGSRRLLICSFDTGFTWTSIPTPDSTSITRITFPDSLHGYAAGQYGAVLRYRPNATGINQPSASTDPGGITLYQNYPNPFTSTTQIRFSIPDAINASVSIQIKVYNMFGEEVAVPARGIYQPGNYTISFNGEDLPPGIYSYRLIAETAGNKGLYTLSGKMIRGR